MASSPDRRRRPRIQFSLAALMLLTLLVAVFFAGRASDRTHPTRHTEMEGEWLLSLPAGFTHTVRVLPAGENRFLLNPGGLNFSGQYAWSEDRFILVEARHKDKEGFAWQVIDRDQLVLVDQPPVSRTGSDYLGATLTRVRD